MDQNASTPSGSAAAGDVQYQADILPGVSRTFALTIPQLPPDLRHAVTNAYLLCRIADTIEDDPDLPAPDKEHWHRAFRSVVAGTEDARGFVDPVLGQLSPRTPAKERELVGNTDRVVAVTHGLRPVQREALMRCVDVMCAGMREFQRNLRPNGLPTLRDMDRYCYYVAGIVGETLTELFCDYCPELAGRYDAMMGLSTSFGQGLQMTNILKDTWDDRARGACWLPRDIFLEEGFDLADLGEGASNPAFHAGLERLVGIAHRHLDDALHYTLMIPPEQTGMRRFCLWALGMAVLTLRRVHANPAFSVSSQVKISRRAVRATILVTNAATASDRTLRMLFRLAGRGLPRGDPRRASTGGCGALHDGRPP